MTFYDKLNRLILRSGKTRQVIAHEMGVKPSLFSKWKAGVPASERSMMKAAKYFGLPFVALADDEAELDSFKDEASPASLAAPGSRITALESRLAAAEGRIASLENAIFNLLKK